MYREKNNEQLADIEKLGRKLYVCQSESSHAILKDTRVIRRDTTQIKKFLKDLIMLDKVSTASANVIGERLKKEIEKQPEEPTLFEAPGISKGTK
jgi:hypothetical protein